MMIEAGFTVVGTLMLKDADSYMYMDENGTIDYCDWVSDNISIECSGQYDVLEVEVYD